MQRYMNAEIIAEKCMLLRRRMPLLHPASIEIPVFGCASACNEGGSGFHLSAWYICGRALHNIVQQPHLTCAASERFQDAGGAPTESA